MAQLIDTIIDGTLDVNGNTGIDGNVEIVGNGSIEGTLNVTDAITIGGKNVSTERSAITVYKNAAQTLTKSYAKIVMGAIFTTVGDAFTFSDGGILINKDCTVEISGSLGVNSATSGDVLYAQIWKNSTNVATISGAKAANSYTDMHITPTFMKVVAGDYIYLYGINNTGARGSLATNAMTKLSVKEI